MTVRIYLLGGMAVEADGRLLMTEEDVPSRAARIAIAYLAMERHRPIPKDELASAIWPEQRPKNWERSLADVIAKLRQLVDRMGFDGREAVPMNLGSYQVPFGPDVWIDVQAAHNALEGAKAALRQDDLRAAWLRGNIAAGISARPFLPGESGSWIELQRRRFRDVRAGGLDVVGEASLRLGDYDVTVTVSEQLLEVDPNWEPAFERLIRAHGMAGRSVAAANVFERYEQTLRHRGLAVSERVARAYQEAVPGSSPQRPPRLVRTFMFTDIVDSTKLIDAMGDSAWLHLSRWSDDLVRTCFAEFGGEEVDHAGDGFLAAFPDQKRAVACAIEIQRRLLEHRRVQGFSPQIRIGLHAAEANKEGGRYIGKGLHEAARIAALAQGDQILSSASTVAGLGDVTVTPGRSVELKGISAPLDVVEVMWF